VTSPFEASIFSFLIPFNSSSPTWYLSTYAPASIQDFAYWTGLTIKETKEIFKLLNNITVLKVKIDKLKGEHFIFEKDIELLEKKPSSYFSIHLLPPLTL